MSTPIRAIPSTLSLKTRPTIPSAAIVYQPYLKSVLQARLWYNIFLTGFVLCWVQCTLSASDKDRWTMLRHDVLLRSVCTWITGFVPVVVLRKAFLTTTRLGQSSPAKTLTAHLSHIQTKISFVLFTFSALCLSLIQEDTPRVFVKSRKHPLYLNPSLVFLVLSQVVVGLMFCLREIMLSDRPVLSFRLRHQTGWATLPFTTSILIALFTTVTLPVTFAIFFSARLALPVMYWFPPFRWVLKPFTNHFFRTSLLRMVFLPLTHLSQVRKAWSIGWSTALVWESAQCLFAIYVSTPITISTQTNDPNTALVAGVTYPTSPKGDEEGKARIYALHAYEELLELFTSTEDASRKQRIKLFEDQRYTPLLIHHLIRESLLWLGKDYSFFLHRGSPPPPPPPSSSSEPKKLPLVPPNTPIGTPAGKVKENTILSKQIFSTPKKSPLKNVLDGLSSEGDIIRVAEDVVGPIPELFRSSTSSLWGGATSPQRDSSSSSVVAPATPSQETLKNWLPSNPIPPNRVILDRLGLMPLQEWWIRERKEKQVRIWIKGDAEMAIGIIRLLSAIICTSLSEDTYGAVQSKIPQILEAFVRFLDEIDVVSSSLSSQLTSSQTPQTQTGTGTGTVIGTEEEEVRKALDALVPLREALKAGLADVVRTFKDKLGAFVFPTRVGKRVEEFLGWVGS